jgi:uncharacterized membrane protein YgaE (UPF0421/DUF939 family)
MIGDKVAVRSWVAGMWLRAQSTVAATTAWLIATEVADRQSPFFAPIVALVVLNFARGGRGPNALWLVAGVGIGVACGEIAVVLFGSGFTGLAVGTFVAMAVVAAITDSNLALNHAGVAAVLTVVIASGEPGGGRLIDALIGAGVALVFTQLIFTPEPVALVRRAEAVTLVGMADSLAATADELEQAEPPIVLPDLSRLRDLRGQLAEVGWASEASQRVVRRAVIWRHRAARVAQMTENAGHLELLGASCIMFIRTAALTESDQRRSLAPHTRALAGVLADLSTDPGNRAVRQRAANRALEVSRELGRELPAQASTSAAVNLRLVILDTVVFAGVDPETAVTAMREGRGELPVISVLSPVRLPFWPGRRG